MVEEIASLNIFAELEKWRALPPEKQAEQMFLQQLVSANCLTLMADNLKTLTNSTGAVTLAVQLHQKVHDIGSQKLAGMRLLGEGSRSVALWIVAIVGSVLAVAQAVEILRALGA